MPPEKSQRRRRGCRGRNFRTDAQDAAEYISADAQDTRRWIVLAGAVLERAEEVPDRKDSPVAPPCIKAETEQLNRLIQHSTTSTRLLVGTRSKPPEPTVNDNQFTFRRVRPRSRMRQRLTEVRRRPGRVETNGSSRPQQRYAGPFARHRTGIRIGSGLAAMHLAPGPGVAPGTNEELQPRS